MRIPIDKYLATSGWVLGKSPGETFGLPELRCAFAPDSWKRPRDVRGLIACSADDTLYITWQERLPRPKRVKLVQRFSFSRSNIHFSSLLEGSWEKYDLYIIAENRLEMLCTSWTETCRLAHTSRQFHWILFDSFSCCGVNVGFFELLDPSPWIAYGRLPDYFILPGSSSVSNDSQGPG